MKAKFIGEFRPLMMDKCTLCVYHRFEKEPHLRKAVIDSVKNILQPYFSHKVARDKGFKRVYFGGRPYFLISEYLKDEEYMQFISHVRLSANYPYSVTFEFNFIRFVRYFLRSYAEMYDDDNFFALKDINPKVEGHSLVIPKKHYETLLDIPSSLLGEYLEIIKEVSLKLIKEEKAEGFNIIMNNYKIAGQIIPHAHIHILPRKNKEEFNSL